MNPTDPDVQMIPIDQISILNPRTRNKMVFQSIVSNISNVGLKRPVKVARRSEPANGKAYDLVCGQGRLEAFVALGQKEIPAIVVDASREECFLMSLVENIARRRHSPIEPRRYRGARSDKKSGVGGHSHTGITRSPSLLSQRDGPADDVDRERATPLILARRGRNNFRRRWLR